MEATDYDRVIRTFIPGYDDMLATIGWWLAASVPPEARVIDLGGGTGALAESVLAKLPRARVELWDIDPKMLEFARGRLRRFADRVTLREQSFTEKLEPCDAVVASLSLHHIPELDTKRAVYANVYESLRSPGIFVTGDCTIDKRGPGGDAMIRYWVEFMATQGIAASDAHKHLSDWEAEDTYVPLADELSALSGAGFERPECFWKLGPIAVFGGVKA